MKNRHKRIVRRTMKKAMMMMDQNHIGFLEEKAQMKAAISSMEENGEIALVNRGMDCDGCAWENSVTILPAILTVVLKHQDDAFKWADGPMSFRIERPSVAKALRRSQRDLGAEAFEDGHPHSISWS